MEWIKENAEWVFSGIGATILTIVVGILMNRKTDKSNLDKKNSQSINSGNNSNNIQGLENINITIGEKKDV